MREVVEIIVAWIGLPSLAYRLVLWDESRLRGERLERAWPRKSRVAAVVGLSIVFWPMASLVALIIHFGRTRRSIAGVALGFAVAALAYAILVLLLLGIELLPDSPLADWTVLTAAILLGVHEFARTWTPWKE
jgi:hypothetical protein